MEGHTMTEFGKHTHFYVARRFDEGGEYPQFVNLTMKDALQLRDAFNKHCGESNRYIVRNYKGQAIG
jgi:hypothetical protein